MLRNHVSKILLVDDEPDIRVILTLALRKTLETEVIAMPTAVEAFEYLQRHTLPDVIVLDRNMPGIDGLAACQRLQAHPRYRTIPIVFLSVCDSSDIAREVMAAGAIAYLSKPFDPMTVGLDILAAVSAGGHR